MFVLVLPGLDCALVQAVRPGTIEQAERSVRFAVPSKKGGTVDRLNHEQRNLPGLDCALVQAVRPGMIEQAERSVHFAVPSKKGGTADRLNHEQKNLPGLTRPEV